MRFQTWMAPQRKVKKDIRSPIKGNACDKTAKATGFARYDSMCPECIVAAH
jgi:hypothetical protein